MGMISVLQEYKQNSYCLAIIEAVRLAKSMQSKLIESIIIFKCKLIFVIKYLV